MTLSVSYTLDNPDHENLTIYFFEEIKTFSVQKSSVEIAYGSFNYDKSNQKYYFNAKLIINSENETFIFEGTKIDFAMHIFDIFNKQVSLQKQIVEPPFDF